MATQALRSQSSLHTPYICRRCILRITRPKSTRRWNHNDTPRPTIPKNGERQAGSRDLGIKQRAKRGLELLHQSKRPASTNIDPIADDEESNQKLNPQWQSNLPFQQNQDQTEIQNQATEGGYGSGTTGDVQTFRKNWGKVSIQEEMRQRDIKDGKIRSVFDILEERGFVNQIAGTRDDLKKLVDGKAVGAYVGIDPTASSMHVGHLVPFMALFWMHIYGYHAVYLVGGATANVGDPIGRTSSRAHQPYAIRAANTSAIHKQLSALEANVQTLASWRRDESFLPYPMTCSHLNNHSWLKQTSIMEVLTMIGTGLRLGAMLGRDTVKNKMEKLEGMSFAEFCYPTLQAFDWWHMYRHHGVQLQIGGADQYGNILSGIDGIKNAIKVSKDFEAIKSQLHGAYGSDLPTPMGFTVPLLTTSSGEKFGKSAGNAIWLDKELTSVFDLYGFFVGQPDSDVERLLKLFTFLPLSHIEKVMAEQNIKPEKRSAQHLLALEFVTLVHGLEEAELAQKQHQSMFSKTALNALPTGWEDQSSYTLHKLRMADMPIPAVLTAAGLSASKSQASRLIQSGGAYIYRSATFTPIKDMPKFFDDSDLVLGADGGKYLILRGGKQKVRVVKVVSNGEE